MNLLTVIIVAIAAFLAVTLILVALLLFAKAKLTTSGDVTININDGQKMLTVAGGSSLLNTLTSQVYSFPRHVAVKVPADSASVRYWRAAVIFCLPKPVSSTANRFRTTGVWDVRSRSRRT